MPLGFDELGSASLRRRRLPDRDFPNDGVVLSGRRGATFHIKLLVTKLLVTMLCCALFLALVVWRG